MREGQGNPIWVSKIWNPRQGLLDVIGELLPEWACLTLQGGTTFLLMSKLVDIPVSRVRKVISEFSFIVVRHGLQTVTYCAVSINYVSINDTIDQVHLFTCNKYPWLYKHVYTSIKAVHRCRLLLYGKCRSQLAPGYGNKLIITNKPCHTKRAHRVTLIKKIIFLFSGCTSFLARLHFSAEELLLYPRRPRPHQRRRPHAKC